MVSHKFLYAIVLVIIFIAIVAFFVFVFGGKAIEEVDKVFNDFSESFKDLFGQLTP